MHPMLSNAVKAARRAGNIITRASEDIGSLKIQTKTYNDFVTEVDKAAEQAIIDTLKELYPTHGFLGEESGESNIQSDFIWIIDPLDGTTNFLHNFPQYCVSIALQHKGEITQAVIYEPNRNDLYTATKGRGAFLNDKKEFSFTQKSVEADFFNLSVGEKLTPLAMAPEADTKALNVFTPPKV